MVNIQKLSDHAQRLLEAELRRVLWSDASAPEEDSPFVREGACIYMNYDQMKVQRHAEGAWVTFYWKDNEMISIDHDIITSQHLVSGVFAVNGRLRMTIE